MDAEELEEGGVRLEITRLVLGKAVGGKKRGRRTASRTWKWS